jgi:hypothetical protein
MPIAIKEKTKIEAKERKTHRRMIMRGREER